MASFFITSTGTGIGKTLVTAGLCWQLRERKKKVTALKPIITGYDAYDGQNDSALILKSCGLEPTPELAETISPWRFSAPLAPMLAAAKEGKTIDVNGVVKFCRDHAGLDTDIVLAEGVGGVMAPLAEGQTVLEWISALNWPVILVGGSYLGSLSHTLTAVDALLGRGLKMAALVVSESEKNSVTLADTVGTLEKFMPAHIPVVKLPRLPVKTEMWKQLPPIHWICNDE